MGQTQFTTIETVSKPRCPYLETYVYRAPNTAIKKPSRSPHESFTKREVKKWITFRNKIGRHTKKNADLFTTDKEKVYKLLENVSSFMGNDVTDYCFDEYMENIQKNFVPITEHRIGDASSNLKRRPLRFCNFNMSGLDWNTYFHSCNEYRRMIIFKYRALRSLSRAGKPCLEEKKRGMYLLLKQIYDAEYIDYCIKYNLPLEPENARVK